MDDVTIAAGALFLIHFLTTKKKRKPKKVWARRLFSMRENTTVPRSMDSGHLKSLTRMSAEDFERLIILVGPKIAKKDTNFRRSIPVQDRLAITLRFLATGESYSSLQYLFKVSKQCIGIIIAETCDALIQELKGQIKIPATPEEWLRISNQFEKRWQFPHCIGAMGGKDIIIQAPFHDGSDFYNYKSNFSIVLFAVVDADYNFTFVDVYCQGRISYGEVFRNTSLYKKLKRNDLSLPQDSVLCSLNKTMPYVFIADEAFPLTNRIMKPFSGMHAKGTIERIFNFRLSRARRVVENAFGILSAVFRVLRKPMFLKPEKAQSIVLTVACLHNFLRKSHSSRNVYTPQGTFDEEDDQGNLIAGTWRLENNSETSFLPIRNMPRKSASTAKEIRNDFAQYLLNNRI